MREEEPGFWSAAQRPGRDDAQLLLAAHVHGLRQEPYEELRRRAGAGPVEEEVPTLSGTTLRRVTRIATHRDGLRILVQVHDGTRAGRLDPLAEEQVLVGPGEDPTGEWTLASEGGDPRRYLFPTPWLPAAMVAGLVVVLALALLVALVR
jgi:hypothetical protein